MKYNILIKYNILTYFISKINHVYHEVQVGQPGLQHHYPHVTLHGLQILLDGSHCLRVADLTHLKQNRDFSQYPCLSQQKHISCHQNVYKICLFLSRLSGMLPNPDALNEIMNIALLHI